MSIDSKREMAVCNNCKSELGFYIPRYVTVAFCAPCRFAALGGLEDLMEPSEQKRILANNYRRRMPQL